jgi:hypothetical protein
MRRLLFMVLVCMTLYPSDSIAGKVDGKFIECISEHKQLRLFEFKQNRVYYYYWAQDSGWLKPNTPTGFSKTDSGPYETTPTNILNSSSP